MYIYTHKYTYRESTQQNKTEKKNWSADTLNINEPGEGSPQKCIGGRGEVLAEIYSGGGQGSDPPSKSTVKRL